MSKHSPRESESQQKENYSLSRNIMREQRSWFAALLSSFRAALKFDRSQITAFQAIRSTIGVAVPLILGIATGQVIIGVIIASGSLTLGSVGLRDPYRTRVRTMLLASLFVALSTFVGGITGSVGWLLILATGIWGIFAGIFASVSQLGLIVGLQACTALIVYAHLAPTPLQAVEIALLLFIGALFQTLLAILPSPWTNTTPERSALATIYQKLADYATNFSEQDMLQLADIMLQGHTTLLNSDTRAEKGQMFARLLDEAERLRLTLTILASSYQRLAKGQQEEKKAGEYLQQIIYFSGDELRIIAQAIKPPPRFTELSIPRPYEEIKQSLAELRKLAQTSGSQQVIQPILPYCSALLAELQIARKLAVSWRYARQYWPVRIHFPYPRPPHLHLEDTWSSIRANLSLQSSAFRHAIRLGVALALATALFQTFHVPVERGYWIPMTALLVLRSDFITTFTRGIARMLGTMLGAVLTTLLVVFLMPSHVALVAIITIAVYLMYSTLYANYAIFSVAVTMAAVFLISFSTPQTVTTALYRAIDTSIGGVLALLIYVLWPTWEQYQVPANIAKRLEALGHYLNAVMQHYAHPGNQQTSDLDKQHMESRLARSNAIGSVRRALQEPKAHRINAELAEGLLGAADNIARSTLRMEAYLHDNPPHSELPEIATFGQQANEALNRLAASLREGHQPTQLPDVQEALRALQAAVKAKKQSPDEAQWHFLISEAKHIVANIQAIQQLLSTGSSTP
jgi:uncharacterized membrane protein YccC